MAKANINVNDAAIAKSKEKMSALNAAFDNAVSVFRSTAEQLECINVQLQEEITEANRMMSFYNEQKACATRAIEDNKSIADRIYEIIGK